MTARINPSALNVEYDKLLKEHGLSLHHRVMPKSHQLRINQELINTAKMEGKASVNFVKRLIRLGGLANLIGPGSTSYNSLILDICKELEIGLGEMHLHLGIPIFAGEFPTGSFNAQARPTKGGVLILLNSGFIDMVYRFGKLQVLCTGFSDPGTREGRFENQYGKNDIIAMFADCLLSYLTYEDVGRAARIPLPGGLRTILTMMFVRDYERFALAHEFGHVMNNDLHPSRVADIVTPIGKFNLFVKDHVREFAADLFAANLLLHLVPLDFPPRADSSEELRLIKASSAATAPFFVLALEKVISDAA
ncbi:MAG: hypothetical protein FJZ87_16150, partial [Chloroflexi bacterium]|nr:hypothetical protein [Chloroflexota bacterium]